MCRRPLLPLLALAALLALLPACRALSCYQCSDQAIIGNEGAGGKQGLPRCADFDEDDSRFRQQECVGTQSKTCSKIVLGNGNVIRGCFGDRAEGCTSIEGATECFCKGDYCNSAPASAPALLLLLLPAALTAALFSV